MDHFAVSEEDWSKIYSTADSVLEIQRKIARFIDSLSSTAVDLAGNVHGVRVYLDDDHDDDDVGFLESFAGTSNFRAGWDVSNADLAGVLVFTGLLLTGDPVVQLKVFFPAWSSSPYLLREDGTRIEKLKLRPGESFEQIVLMNVIRKQVDMST